MNTVADCSGCEDCSGREVQSLEHHEGQAVPSSKFQETDNVMKTGRRRNTTRLRKSVISPGMTGRLGLWATSGGLFPKAEGPWRDERLAPLAASEDPQSSSVAERPRSLARDKRWASNQHTNTLNRQRLRVKLTDWFGTQRRNAIAIIPSADHTRANGPIQPSDPQDSVASRSSSSNGS